MKSRATKKGLKSCGATYNKGPEAGAEIWLRSEQSCTAPRCDFHPSSELGENKVEIEDGLQNDDADASVNGKRQEPPLQAFQNEKLHKNGIKNKFSEFIAGLSIKSGYRKFRPSKSLSSASTRLRQFAEGRDEFSRSVPSTPRGQTPPVDSNDSIIMKIDWASLWDMAKAWIKNPMNIALLVWIIGVAISGAILFMVMTGMLNAVLPRKSQRDVWFEVNNQILNALFTLMCLYQHPRRFYHLALLLRWEEQDILRLRKIYCKNGTYKPHEWFHMMVVVLLLHLNCFAQYSLCGLNLGYNRSRRPPIGVALCLSVAIGAPAAAAIYNILSPLGREYELEVDQESQVGDRISAARVKSLEKKFSFALKENRRVPESSPQWAGRLFDFWDDISLAYLSLFCSFCVFGWNMDRLGFGNMYVHIATFLLLCMAPFFIFNLAAINIDNETIREALGFTGIILCVFGLLYGGFWRIQMRRKFNLPANRFCCGSPSVTDCFQWLCCCSCSLAQEVRTADFYDIVEDKFFSKHMSEGTPTMMSPLQREEGSTSRLQEGSPLFKSDPSSPLWGASSPPMFTYVHTASPSRFGKAPGHDKKLSIVEEESSSKGDKDDTTMTPPHSSQIRRDENQTP